LKGPDRGRHRVREGRDTVGRGAAAVHGNRWQDHELPARGVPRLHRGRRAGRWSPGSFTCPGPGPGTPGGWPPPEVRREPGSGRSRSSWSAHVLATPADGRRADALAAKLPKRAWQQMSCGDGPKASAATTGRWSPRSARGLAAGSQERLAAVRAGLLPLPHALPGPAQPPGPGREGQAGGRGALPGRQERSRDGPLPGQAPRELVPLRHSRHARPGLPRRHPGRSRRRQHQPGQLGQRDPPHVHRALQPAPATSSTPGTGHDGANATKNAPDAATTNINDYKITKCGWSTSHSPPAAGAFVTLDAGTVAAEAELIKHD